jgi:hypothetical protein
MNQYQEGFQTSILDTIFKVGQETWEKIGIAYLGYNAATIAIMLVVGTGVFATGMIGLDDLANSEEFAQRMIMGDLNIAFFVIMGIIMIPMLFVMTWFEIIKFSIVDDKIKTGKINLKNAFEKSKDVGFIFKILGSMVGLYILTVAGLSILGFAGAAVTPALGVGLVFVGLFATIKLTLVIPAMVLGHKTFDEAMSFSIKHITFIRSLKLIGIGILACLIFGLVGAVMSIPAMMLASLPVLSGLFQLLFQLAIGLFGTVFGTVAMTGLYYRYAPEIEEETSFESDNVFNY